MLLYTLGLAFIFVLISVGLLAISWLITGKTKIQAGACGRAPKEKKSSECGNKASCQLCEHYPLKDSEAIESEAASKAKED